MNTRSATDQEDTVTIFNKKLKKLTSKARLEDGEISFIKPLVSNVGLISLLALPMLLQDIISKVDQWGHRGESGRIDPFTEVYDVSLAIRALVDSVLNLSLPARLPPDGLYDYV